MVSLVVTNFVLPFLSAICDLFVSALQTFPTYIKKKDCKKSPSIYHIAGLVISGPLGSLG